jgi:transcriptional regulator with XRE-family HTH domain
MSRYTKSQRITDHIGASVKAAREAAGLSQRQLAGRVYGGLGSGTISRIERGEHGPSIETLGLIALVLGVEPATLQPTLEQLPAMLGVDR